MAVVNAPEPFCQYHLRNWLIQTICHTPWQLKFEWQFGEVHWFDSANQRHPKRNAIYYHHCNKKWKSSCVSITESSLITVIEPVGGWGGGVLVQLHNPNLIAVYPGKWPPHLKYSTYVPKKATRCSYQNLNAFWFGHFTRTSLIGRFFKSAETTPSRRMIIR